MAQIPNTRALTEGDGLNDYFNVDTVNKRVDLPNGASIALWSDAYTTSQGQIKNGNIAPAQSGTAPAVANAGTINTAGLGVSRVSPASAVTGIILAAGTLPGQQITVVNESAAANYIQFAAAGTSNVADGINQVIPGLQSRQFTWDSVTALWYSEPATTNGTVFLAQSATAPDPGAGGTITTTGVGVARVSPAAARTGIIVQAGVFPGQQIIIVNEATAANTLTLNTTPATANVADSATEAAIAGLTARAYVWDSVQALWYPFK